MQRQVPELISLLALLAIAPACQKSEQPQAGGTASPLRGTGDEFALTADVGGDVSTGSTAELVTRVEAKKGFYINAEYPISFRPEKSSEGVRFEQDRYALADSAERTPCEKKPENACTFRAKVPFTATSPGEQTVAGILAFSVCNPERCLIEKQPVEVKVSVR